MKFEDIIGKEIVIEFNNDLEKEEFKQWCDKNNVDETDILLTEIALYYRVDSYKRIKFSRDKHFYLENGYQIINYKEFNKLSFKELFNQYSVHCDTKEKAKHFLQLCDDNDIVWCSGHKALLLKGFYEGEDTCYCLNKEVGKLAFSDGAGEYTITYEEFIDKLSVTSIKEEVNNNILKDLINKYLIKDGDFNNDSLSLIDFINECNDRFKLNLL